MKVIHRESQSHTHTEMLEGSSHESIHLGNDHPWMLKSRHERLMEELGYVSESMDNLTLIKMCHQTLFTS